MDRPWEHVRLCKQLYKQSGDMTERVRRGRGMVKNVCRTIDRCLHRSERIETLAAHRKGQPVKAARHSEPHKSQSRQARVESGG